MVSPIPQTLNINRRTIFTNIAILSISTFITQGLLAALLLLTARQIGPKEYGIYSSSIALATFLSIFFNLGLNQWMLREGGRKPFEIGNILGSVSSIKLVLGIVWLLIIFLVSNYTEISSLTPLILQLASVNIFFGSLHTTIVTAFKSVLRNTISTALDVTSILIQFIVTILLINQHRLAASEYIQARTFVLMGVFGVSYLFSFYVLRTNTSRTTVKGALRECPPYAASELLALLFLRVDLLVIALRLDMNSAGVYSVAEGIINALFVVPNIVNFVTIPMMSNLLVSNPQRAWYIARRALVLLFLIGIGLVVAVFPLSQVLLIILGPKFTASKQILEILAVILLLHSLSNGMGAILVAMNQQSKRAIIQAIAVVVNVILNLAIIGKWGITGVAYVYIFTEIILLLGSTWLVYKYRIK